MTREIDPDALEGAGEVQLVDVRTPEERDAGRWRPLATTRSGKRGRFSRRYTFSRTSRPRTFRFRVRAPREAAYPYATGNSRTVRVRVG